jgi:hypothetical protein
MFKTRVLIFINVLFSIFHKAICQGNHFFQLFANKIKLIIIKKELIVSNFDPKYNQSITISAFNVPNFTAINIGYRYYHTSKFIPFILVI